MIAITPAIETLLKSKVMVGENRPTATFAVEGQPRSIDGATWYDTPRALRSGADAYSGGNFVTRADGKILVCYANITNQTIMLATVDDEVEDLLYDDNKCADTEWVVLSAGNGDFVSIASGFTCSIFKMDNGELLLFVADSGYSQEDPRIVIDQSLKVFKSENGLGTDFTLLSSTTVTSMQSQTSGTIISNQVGLPIQLASGRLVVGIRCSYYLATWISQYSSWVLVSDDFGETWSYTKLHNDQNRGPLIGRNFANFNGRLVCLYTSTYSIGGYKFYYSDDDGSTWSACTSRSDTGHNLHSMVFWDKRSGTNWYVYATGIMGGNFTLWTCPDTLDFPIDGQEPYSMDFWEQIYSITTLSLWNNNTELFYISEAGNLIYSGPITDTNPDHAMILGAITTPIIVPVISITVDRSKGSASQATVLLDNKNGIYAPDNIESQWFQKIWLNKEITITMGYGAEQQQVFKGLIDEITMNNYADSGATLEVLGRDLSKRALDQMAQMYWVDHWAYVILWQWSTPEQIFSDLAVMAGWPIGNIHTEITGLTLPEFKVVHEQYADAFQRLAEITGFEWVVDEIGDIYFRAAVDPAPVAVWVFREGEDIFKLSYKFSDAELYRDFVVWSLDANGLAVRGKVTWSAADYNNVLPHKTTISQAADIVMTYEGCVEVAQRQADAITPKPRSVDFVVVGNPYLQIGDCVQVIESTSTISELYRIFEMTHQIDASSGLIFGTTLKCYHYAYVPI